MTKARSERGKLEDAAGRLFVRAGSGLLEKAAALLALLAFGCWGDETELAIRLPSLPVASGTSATFDVRNTHVASKIHGPPGLERVDSISLDDTAMATVRPSDKESHSRIIYFELDALRPGDTTIRARGTFDDGTHDRATATLRVREIDEVKLMFRGCPESATDPQLIQRGKTIEFDATLWGGGEELSGDRTPAMLEVEHASFLPAGFWRFVAPEEDSEFVVESPLLGKTLLTLETFGPERITGVGLGAIVVVGGTSYRAELLPEIEGRIPCQVGPFSVTTATPEICLGDLGKETWEVAEAALVVAPVLAGTCRLKLTPVGASIESEVEFEVDVLE